MIRAFALAASIALATPTQAEEVWVNAKSYTFLSYERLQSYKPKGFLALSWPEIPFRDVHVMIPLTYTFCDFFYMQKEAGREPRNHVLFSGLVGHLFKDTLPAMLIDDTDYDQLTRATEHCLEVSKGPSGGLFKNPMFFVYGVLRQDPWTSKPGRFSSPELDLHGAVFTGEYGESAWFPSYGALPPYVRPPTGLPERYTD